MATTERTTLELDIECVAKAYARVIGEPPSAPLGAPEDAKAWRSLERDVAAYVKRALDVENGSHRGTLGEITERVASLGRYFASQRAGVERALQSCGGYVPRIHSETTSVERAFEAKLRELSLAFVAARGDEKHVKWSPPSKFERRTVKYWVRERDVVPLQLAVLKHLPILDFKDEGQVGTEDDALITSVYVENASFDAYHDRLQREQGATLVRYRWYGGGVPQNAPVFIERKTHHESWSGEKSVKERCKLVQADAMTLMSGAMPANLASEKLVREIFDDEITRRKMSTGLMTRYRRTAFQRTDSNDVRVSLDTQVRWQDVRALGPVALSNPPDDSRSKTFHFAVLEIKLAAAEDEEPMPEWLESIVHDFDVVEVYKFSKYQHGCALLYPNSLKRFPHWYGCDDDAGELKRMPSPMASGVHHVTVVNCQDEVKVIDIRRSESTGSFTELMRAAVATLKFRKNEAKREDELGDVETAARGEAPSRPRHVPIKVEPKTFFANERTLLQWLSMSILLLFLALGLLSIDRQSSALPLASGSAASLSSIGNPFAGAICGVILAPISILFMLYALWTFIVRARRIARREPSARYDDMYGPVALVFLLVVIAVVAVSVSSSAIDWEHV